VTAGGSPLSRSRCTIFVVFEVAGIGLETACPALGVDSLVLSDSGEEGSKSSRERFAIFKY
jgi:hypothetical protein